MIDKFVNALLHIKIFFISDYIFSVFPGKEKEQIKSICDNILQNKCKNSAKKYKPILEAAEKGKKKIKEEIEEDDDDEVDEEEEEEEEEERQKREETKEKDKKSE